MSELGAQRKGILDRIRGMLGDAAAHDRDLVDQEIRQMEAEVQKLRRFAGQLYDAADDAISDAWLEAWELLGRGADDLEREIEASRNELEASYDADDADDGDKSQPSPLRQVIADLEKAA